MSVINSRIIGWVSGMQAKLHIVQQEVSWQVNWSEMQESSGHQGRADIEAASECTGWAIAPHQTEQFGQSS